MCGAGATAKEPGLEPVQREKNDRVITHIGMQNATFGWHLTIFNELLHLMQPVIEATINL